MLAKIFPRYENKKNNKIYQLMKSYFYFALVLLIAVGCSPEESAPSFEEVQENIDVGIIMPLKERDYSFHNNGDYGVYEIPADQKNFKGKIEFSGEVNVSPNNLRVKWISDIDGELYESHPDNNFESTISTSLSKGLHKISFEVYLGNNSELIQKDSITVSNVIKLEATPRLGRMMRLNWTKYEGSDFVSYLIYHDDNQPVAEINDVNTLEYDYSETFNIMDEHPYQIVVKTSNPALSTETVGSNIVKKTAGDFLYVPYYIRKMIKDPVRHKLYAICTPADLYEVADKYGVIVINTDTFSIESHILPNFRCTDLAVSPDGQYMYLTRRQVDNILKVNLNTFSYTTITTYTSGYGFDEIEAGTNNLVYANPYNSASPGQMINTQTGLYTSAQSSLTFGQMAYNPLNNILYMGSDTSSSNLYMMNTTNWATGNYLNLTQFPQFPGGVGYPYPNLFVSDAGNHIFWDEYQLDANLNIERQFNDILIKACSPSNQYISDLSKLYNFDTMDTILTYPSFGYYEFYNSDIHFADENTIFTNKTYDPNDGNPSYSYIFRMKIN
jgi:hypothetical protein